MLLEDLLCPSSSYLGGLFQCNHRNSGEESHLKAFTSAARLSYETVVGLNIKNIQTALKKAQFEWELHDCIVGDRHLCCKQTQCPANKLARGSQTQATLEQTNPTDGGY